MGLRLRSVAGVVMVQTTFSSQFFLINAIARRWEMGNPAERMMKGPSAFRVSWSLSRKRAENTGLADRQGCWAAGRLR